MSAVSLTIPELSLVVLVGPSGSGKSTFARAHFAPTEILSSDACRALVSDDENNQSATKDAFEVLHAIAAKRLARGLLTVVDATNVQPEARKPLVELARRFHVLPVALVLDLPERLCHERNRSRPDRAFGPHVIAQQRSQLQRSLRGFAREGFRHVHVLKSPEQVAQVSIARQPLWTNKRHEHGPFDIIGDVHGCADELQALLATLGYVLDQETFRHPDGRRVVFLGDLVDRGPGVVRVLRTVMRMVAAGTALCVPGNHDVKLMRALQGKQVTIAHGLQESLAQLAVESEAFRHEVAAFIDGLVSHYVLDGGALVVAHAGMKEEMQGRGSGKVREFALFGETTGETDEFGLPVRHNWAAEYRGAATVVYGHTPVPEPEWINRTINIDTGCVFGGRLTALRYPEREVVSVPAMAQYAAPVRPLAPVRTGEAAATLSSQQALDDVLDLADVSGKRIVTTGLHRTVTIREENATAALEVMSRFAVNPKWLIYLPPTMSPPETSAREGYLEHPYEALDYYRRHGVETVVCEEKHMGSRAVVVVCRDEDAARHRFGIVGEGAGIVYTRTGRRFFGDPALETALLAQVRDGASDAGLWEELRTDWLLLDAELMPWSVKAQDLIRQQYAAVGEAAEASLSAASAVLSQGVLRHPDLATLQAETTHRAELARRYSAAYRRYCWSVTGLADLRLAPFHILASEGAVHHDKDHRWHLELAQRLCRDRGPVLFTTDNRVVSLGDAAAVDEVTAWWEVLTERGGEGMVVKPLEFVTRDRRGLIQPAVKCRGREYLRIIYGPEYSLPANLDRLRQRGLAAKRSLALREFALGIEGLERFVAREPLRRVHECVFGVLALESEPVDPRL